MDAYVPGEQLRKPGIIKLNTNENPYPPSPSVCAALKGFDTAGLRRYPPPNSGGLREAIAKELAVPDACVFAGNGSDEILALATRSFVDEGQSIGYFTPSYSLYPVLAAIRDVPARAVSLGDGFAWRDPDAVEDCGLFFITNPNAPTGMPFPKARIESFCEHFKGVVLVDEAYADFAEWNCLDLALRHPNVLVSRSFSKSYSLAGLRVGFVVGHPDLIAAMDTIRDSYNLDSIAQQLAQVAIEDSTYMRERVACIKRTREALADGLQALGFDVFPSSTNFVWTRPPVGMSAGDYAESLKSRDILIRFFDKPELDQYVRISVGTDDEIKRLLEVTVELTGNTTHDKE